MMFENQLRRLYYDHDIRLIVWEGRHYWTKHYARDLTDFNDFLFSRVNFEGMKANEKTVKAQELTRDKELNEKWEDQ